MNKEIKQLNQEINYEDILNKKFYPVWFFTNERINNFFPVLEKNRDIKKVFSIGSGGDFIFSLLSTQFKKINEVNVCDIRQMACISIDLKIALFKNLSYEEFLNIFFKKKSLSCEQVYKRIKKTITLLSDNIIKSILINYNEDNFLKCLKKSSLWYRDSFWQIKNKTDYLLYLISKKNYNYLKKNLHKITIYSGDFNQNLQEFQNNYFDLIYTSNILDSKKYCRENDIYLQSIKNKLNKNGLLFVITQNSPKKMIKLIENKGFFVKQKQINKFNLIRSFLGHYDYSCLLFQKKN